MTTGDRDMSGTWSSGGLPAASVAPSRLLPGIARSYAARSYAALGALAAAVALAGATLAGCAASDDASSIGEGRAAGAPPPLVLPRLTGLEPTVQDQVRARHAAVLALEGDAGAAAEALADAYGELGLVLQAAGFYEAAEHAFLNAQAGAPAAVRWRYYLAHLFQLTGQRGRALEGFRHVVDLDPSNLPALVWLGEMYLDQGQPAAAERVYDRALALQPASSAVLAGIGRAALAREDAARAVTYLERALAVDPGATSLHYSLGMAYRDLGQLELAEQYLRQRGGGAPGLADPLLQQSTGLLDSALAHERRGSRAPERRAARRGGGGLSGRPRADAGRSDALAPPRRGAGHGG